MKKYVLFMLMCAQSSLLFTASNASAGLPNVGLTEKDFGAILKYIGYDPLSMPQTEPMTLQDIATQAKGYNPALDDLLTNRDLDFYYGLINLMQVKPLYDKQKKYSGEEYTRDTENYIKGLLKTWGEKSHTYYPQGPAQEEIDPLLMSQAW